MNLFSITRIITNLVHLFFSQRLVYFLIISFLSFNTFSQEQKLYWTDESFREINQSNLDGSSRQNILQGLGLGLGLALDIAEGKIYWIEPSRSRIRRANLDGSNEENIISSLFFPSDLTLDLSTRRMYWVNRGDGTIYRANLDGTGRIPFITTKAPIGITLDVKGGNIYWTQSNADTIRWININNPEIRDSVSTEGVRPRGITTRSDSSKMYWADFEANKIRRANLDGSDIEDVFSTGLNPEDVIIDTLANKIYWTESGKIRQANLDGSGMQDIITEGQPVGVTLDNINGKIYWTDIETFKIRRANLDGTQVENIIQRVGELGIPTGITLDLKLGNMYWLDLDREVLSRSNLNGSEGIDLVTNINAPQGIALDLDRGKVYWTEGISDPNAKIRQANLDGSNVEDVITGLNSPRDIALDLSVGKMYWSDSGTDKISRANLDGSDEEDLILKVQGVDSAPFGIALDTEQGKIYWTDFRLDIIQRANLDGSDQEIIIDSLNNPRGIAIDLDKQKLYWTDIGLDNIRRANLDGTEIEDVIVDDLSGPNGIALAILFAPDGLLWNRRPINNNDIELTWQNKDLQATGIIIERSVVDNASFTIIDTLASDIISYIDRGLNPNTTYFYRLKAISPFASSCYSDTLIANTLQLNINLPLAPVGLVATEVSHTRIDLAWQDNSDNELGFLIFQKVPNKNFEIVDTTQKDINFYTSKGLEPDSRYSYFVRAYNQAGISSSSNVVIAKTLTNSPTLFTPSALRTEAISSNRIDLNWNDNSDNEQGFIIERFVGSNPNPQSTFFSPPNNTGVSDENLRPNTTYFYRVRAFTGSDTSAYSNWNGATTGSDVLTAIAESNTKIDIELEVYPNPNHGEFILKLPNDGIANPINLDIYNTWGEKVKAFSLDTISENYFLDIRNLPAGLYYLQVKTSEGVIQEKILKY